MQYPATRLLPCLQQRGLHLLALDVRKGRQLLLS